MLAENTDQHRAITLQHLSPSWVERLDRKYGVVKAENGGYCDFHIHFDGKSRPRWWDIVLRVLEHLGIT